MRVANVASAHARESVCTYVRTGVCVAGSTVHVCRRRVCCSSESRLCEQVASPSRTRSVCPVPSCVDRPHRLTQTEREPSRQEQAAGLALERAGTSAPGSRAGGWERAVRTRSWCTGLGDVHCLAQHVTTRKMGEPALLQLLPNCAPAPQHTALLQLLNPHSLSSLRVIDGRAELYLRKAFSIWQYASATQLQICEI